MTHQFSSPSKLMTFSLKMVCADELRRTSGIWTCRSGLILSMEAQTVRGKSECSSYLWREETARKVLKPLFSVGPFEANLFCS